MLLTCSLFGAVSSCHTRTPITKPVLVYLASTYELLQPLDWCTEELCGVDNMDTHSLHLGSLSTSLFLPPFSKSPLERVPTSLNPTLESFVPGTAGTERSVPDLVRPPALLPVRKSSLLAQFTWFWKNASLSLNDMQPVTMSFFSPRDSVKIQALDRAGDVIPAPNERIQAIFAQLGPDKFVDLRVNASACFHKTCEAGIASMWRATHPRGRLVV